MYVIDCRKCRTPFSVEARICPRCGGLNNYARAWPDQGRKTDLPLSERGESEWGEE